jgi:carbamoyltransferase
MNQETTKASEKLTAPLRVDSADLAWKIREGLLGIGFSGDAMRELVPETADAATAMKMDHAAIAERIGMETPVACLMRAFLLRAATPEARMREAIGEELFALCDEAGLWQRVEGGVVGTAVFLEDGGMFLLSDHTSQRLGEVAMYWVMNIGTSTLAVAESIARRPYDRVLDLCCGSGVQAFYRSGEAKEVIAIDRNPRALNYGRFGAGMNGYRNIEFRESDCYSAVEGETFDLIACNPPYVMTPDRQAYYRDGGMGGDRFSERILREAPAYLREGGFVHVTCDVGAMGGKSSLERLRGWLEGNGCDVLALGGKRLGAAEYAKAWLKADTKEYAEAEGVRWAAYLGELGIESVQNFLVVMRKRSGTNWFHFEMMPGTRKGYFGHQVARTFSARDLLKKSDREIWEARLRLAPEMRLQHTVRPEGGTWKAERSRITFAEGLISEFEVEPRTAGLLAMYDGKRKSEEVLARVAQEMGGKPSELRDGWVGYLRHLIENRILEQAVR